MSTDRAAMTLAQVMDLPATVDVETAGRAFGLGRTSSYALARRGQFPCRVLRVGRLLRVVTADLAEVLNAPAIQPQNGDVEDKLPGRLDAANQVTSHQR